MSATPEHLTVALRALHREKERLEAKLARVNDAIPVVYELPHVDHAESGPGRWGDDAPTDTGAGLEAP